MIIPRSWAAFSLLSTSLASEAGRYLSFRSKSASNWSKLRYFLETFSSDSTEFLVSKHLLIQSTSFSSVNGDAVVTAWMICRSHCFFVAWSGNDLEIFSSRSFNLMPNLTFGSSELSPSSSGLGSDWLGAYSGLPDSMSAALAWLASLNIIPSPLPVVSMGLVSGFGPPSVDAADGMPVFVVSACSLGTHIAPKGSGAAFGTSLSGSTVTDSSGLALGGVCSNGKVGQGATAGRGVDMTCFLKLSIYSSLSSSSARSGERSMIGDNGFALAACTELNCSCKAATFSVRSLSNSMYSLLSVITFSTTVEQAPWIVCRSRFRSSSHSFISISFRF